MMCRPTLLASALLVLWVLYEREAARQRIARARREASAEALADARWRIFVRDNGLTGDVA